MTTSDLDHFVLVLFFLLLLLHLSFSVVLIIKLTSLPGTDRVEQLRKEHHKILAIFKHFIALHASQIKMTCPP